MTREQTVRELIKKSIEQLRQEESLEHAIMDTVHSFDYNKYNSFWEEVRDIVIEEYDYDINFAEEGGFKEKVVKINTEYILEISGEAIRGKIAQLRDALKTETDPQKQKRMRQKLDSLGAKYAEILSEAARG